MPERSPGGHTRPNPSLRPGRGWYWLAAVFAALHSVPSLYWAAGGRAFVWTVGDWAADLAARYPAWASLGLLMVALAKLTAGAVPIANSYGMLPGQRTWQRIILGGSILLTLYGGANTLVGGLALLGWFGPLAESNRRALMGHVFCWDPLFLCWGACLFVGTVLQMRASRDLRQGDQASG